MALHRRSLSTAALVISSLWAGAVSAQPDQPAPEPAQPGPDPAQPAPGQPATPDAPPEGGEVTQGLRLHFVSTQRTYVPLEYDIFSIATGEVVGNGRGAIESRGEEADVWELPPGMYKIVKHGEPF